MPHVTRIVVNETTDGIILIMDNGSVVPFGYFSFAESGDTKTVKQKFLKETETGEVVGWPAPYARFANEVEHPDALVVYTKESGWIV